jgi:hypothetical protein
MQKALTAESAESAENLVLFFSLCDLGDLCGKTTYAFALCTTILDQLRRSSSAT